VDIVWICRTGPNEELRYSIRSVAKNMPHENIVVVGGKPDWYTGRFIPVETFIDNHRSTNKYANAKNNIHKIVDEPSISDEFIFMNDDFYVVKPVDRLQHYHGGYFEDKLKLFKLYAAEGSYTKMLQRTMATLDALEIDAPLDYTLHIPILYQKNKLAETLKYDGSTRTLYGNMHRVGGRLMEDVKVHPKRSRDWAPQPFDYMHKDMTFLSTSDSSFEQVKKNLLGPLFPEPSKYESSH
jgi:hypothetical protein